MLNKRQNIFFKILLLSNLSVLLFCHFNILQSRESIVKSGFIAKFIEYTTWPTNNKSTFDIKIIGDSDIETALQQVFINHPKVKSKKVVISQINNIDEINNCDILFIGRTEKKNLDSILSWCQNKPILLISDGPDFGKKGTHINFYITDNQTIHFEINLKTLDGSGIKTDMFLLQIAKVLN